MAAPDQPFHLMLIEAAYRKAGCTNGSYSVFDMGYVPQGRLRFKGGLDRV
jgi:hypothetical protein